MLAGSAGKTMRISPGKRYPNDQAQHLNTTYRIVGPVSASCGQTIPTFEPNRDANIYGRNMLHAFGHLVATRCDMLRVENRYNNVARKPDQTTTTLCNINKYCVKNVNIFKFKPTTPNMSQHIATRRDRVAKRTQLVASNNVAISYVEML